MHGYAYALNKFVKGLLMPGKCKAEDESTSYSQIPKQLSRIIMTNPQQ